MIWTNVATGMPIDTNGDGIADSIAIDTVGDGRVDTILRRPPKSACGQNCGPPVAPSRATATAPVIHVDTTGDGIADSVAIDTVGDGRVDTILWRPESEPLPVESRARALSLPVDTTGDGLADSIAIDTTGDGHVDTILHVRCSRLDPWTSGVCQRRALSNTLLILPQLLAEPASQVASHESGAAHLGLPQRWRSTLIERWSGEQRATTVQRRRSEQRAAPLEWRKRGQIWALSPCLAHGRQGETRRGAASGNATCRRNLAAARGCARGCRRLAPSRQWKVVNDAVVTAAGPCSPAS